MPTTLAERTLILAERILAEYQENQDLQLTRWQSQQLWRLDVAECDAVLQALVLDRGFLRLSRDGAFVLESLIERATVGGMSAAQETGRRA
jgi:hypothetical protein